MAGNGAISEVAVKMKTVWNFHQVLTAGLSMLFYTRFLQKSLWLLPVHISSDGYVSISVKRFKDGENMMYSSWTGNSIFL